MLELVNMLRDPKYMCGHCSYYGEPNGCNLMPGGCTASTLADEAAYLIETLTEECDLYRANYERLQRDAQHEYERWKREHWEIEQALPELNGDKRRAYKRHSNRELHKQKGEASNV